MEIKLISKTPNYLKTCWTAARTCYSADSPIELLTEEKLQKLYSLPVQIAELQLGQKNHRTVIPFVL